MTIPGCCERFESNDGLELQAPADDAAISAAEMALDATFPPELCELYRSSDGVFDGPGQWFMVWPLTRVVDQNRFDWADSDARDADRLTLVGFGDDGPGAAFCVPRNGGSGIFLWAALDHKAVRLADSIGKFWTRWRDNSLPHY